jgi:hypothetical protein
MLARARIPASRGEDAEISVCWQTNVGDAVRFRVDESCQGTKISAARSEAKEIQKWPTIR